jgi:FMNH2-dependent dimethyl sulfone monooxygenase
MRGNVLKAKLGVYIPVYGGWLRGVEEGENEPTFKYASEAALKAENMGIDSIWVPDHLLNPMKGESAGSLEAWTTLTALATLTSRVELFHTTLCQGFRYPAVLAKMGTTLDDISEGRFRFALGAGWFEREFQAYGSPWHDHDTRIARAREQIEIVKALWTQPTTNYKGRFFEITNGIVEPKPIQKPHPPVWWGGESEESRRLVADLADGWLISASTLQGAEDKVMDMAKRLDKRGREEIQFSIPGRIYMGRTDEEARKRVEKLARGNPNLVKAIIDKGFVGSPQAVAERVQGLWDLGFDYVVFQASPALRVLDEIEESLLPLL